MNKRKFIFSVAAAFLVSLSVNTFAQQTPAKPAEPSYEVVLQVLVASNNAADKSSAAVVPQNLSSVVKKLKNDYSFANYRVAETYFQRVANTGNVSSNGISSQPNQDVFAPVFSEWSVQQLQVLPDEKGRNSVSILNFRFGQRVPVKTASSGDEGEKAKSVVNYQQVGIWAQKLNFAVNTPTVVGNLTTSKTDEATFLILTVKPVDE